MKFYFIVFNSRFVIVDLCFLYANARLILVDFRLLYTCHQLSLCPCGLVHSDRHLVVVDFSSYTSISIWSWWTFLHANRSPFGRGGLFFMQIHRHLVVVDFSSCKSIAIWSWWTCLHANRSPLVTHNSAFSRCHGSWGIDTVRKCIACSLVGYVNQSCICTATDVPVSWSSYSGGHSDCPSSLCL